MGDLNGDDYITPADAAIALRLAASGGWDANADVNRGTMKTYRNCIGADSLCARVSHPLNYYRIRKRGAGGSGTRSQDDRMENGDCPGTV